MKRTAQHKIDIYTELCPASSVAIIGSGLVTLTMGELPLGAAIALTGIAVGVAGPLAKSFMQQRTAVKR
jgi:hypothetical protein